jgi:uncharacterized protein (UPF0218 family)
MTKKPVLVVHGIANHDRAEFESHVTKLQIAISKDLPDVQLVPVFWGDLGGQSQDISDCLPLLKVGQWATRAEGILSIPPVGLEVRGEPILNNDQRASIIAGSVMSAELVRTEPHATKAAIAEALRHTDHLQRIDDPELLRAVGDIVSETLAENSATPAAGGFEVRGEYAAPIETRGRVKDRVSGVISGIDKLLGKLVEDRLGVLNHRLRSSLMNGLAVTLGDIVAYHSNKKGIQQRLWDAVASLDPGYGTQAKPIGVIAHSLGGVVSFDSMFAPANGTTLYVDSFVTFGSQAAFFEIIDPRTKVSYSTGQPITLPDTLKKWINLWDVVDLLAFTAGTVFRLSDGARPEDLPVEDPISVLLDAKLWLHSIYWQTPQLVDALVKAFR